MTSCKCGSWAINPQRHGRDNEDLDLCDVCYWRTRAESQAQEIAELKYDGPLAHAETNYEHEAAKNNELMAEIATLRNALERIRYEVTTGVHLWKVQP